ncbi:MAG: mammalian cell entry protein [Gemmatimonadales bacterium]|nr:MAG: mammalian cell entry protein [Gemmatimonadales bacterium]
MDLHYKQELTVGALVILAVVIFTAGLMWLSGRSIGPSGTVVVPVRFTNAGGLRPGDPVQISGVKVGRVASVVLEDVGNVMVYLEVDRANRPRVDAQAIVASADFFGAKYVDYIPGSSPEFLKEGQVITGTREVAITESAAELSGRAAEALAGVQSLLSERTAEDIHNALVALERALNLLTEIAGGPAVREARSTLNALNQLAVRLDSTFANPDLGKSLNQLDETVTALNEMSQGLATATNALGSILAKVDSGQGTLGRMVTDSTLHQDLHEVLRSLKLLLDDIRERPGRYVNVKVF